MTEWMKKIKQPHGLKGGAVEVVGVLAMVADRSGGDQNFECPTMHLGLMLIAISFMCYLII